MAKQLKIEANRKLIGKTVNWQMQKETFIGVVVDVIDENNLLVITTDKVNHQVSLWDITSVT